MNKHTQKATPIRNLKLVLRSWLRVAFFVFALTGVFLYTRAQTPVAVEAAANSTLNFQARLYTSGGNKVPDGTYSVAFNLYEEITGGSSLWNETQGSVSVKNGYFSVELGSTTPFGAGITWDDDKFLTMNVNSDGEMNPRIKLTATPYAFQAAQANQLKISNGAFTSSLTLTTPTATRSIVIPDASGTVALLENAQTFTGAITFGASGTGLTVSQAATIGGDLAVNGGDITSTGALNITPGGALTLGATNQATTLQGTSTTITSNGAGNDIVLTSADQIRLTGFNCTTYANGGNLTTDASGNITCADDNGGSGSTGTVDTSGTPATGQVAYFADADTIQGSGAFTFDGTDLYIGTTAAAGDLVLNDGNGQTTRFVAGDTSADLSFVFPTAYAASNGQCLKADTAGVLSFSNCNNGSGAGGAVTLQNAYDASTTPEITVDATRGALTIQDNAVALGANLLEVTSNGGGTTYFAVDANGASVSGSFAVSSNITVTGNSTVNGNTTTGDSSADTNTVNATSTFNAAVTIAANQYLRLVGGTTLNRPASPTEGMLFYDTDTNRLLTYTGGKWQSTGGEYTIVAASNSPQAIRDAADYVTDGDNVPGAGTIDGDQVEINAALTAAAGGKVYLAQGTYVADATILIPNNTTLAGAGRGTLIELADIDTTDNLIENSDTTTGTGVTIQDLRLDGRKDLNTAGTQNGIYFNGMGAGTGASARSGSELINLSINNLRSNGIYLSNSANNTLDNSEITSIIWGIILVSSSKTSITGSTFLGSGFRLDTSSYTNFVSNIVEGATSGISLNDSNFNNFSDNIIRSSASTGFYAHDSHYNTVKGNSIVSNESWGIGFVTGSLGNIVESNRLSGNGGATDNNAMQIAGDNNTVLNNAITDSSATSTNIGISISSNSSGTYLGNNILNGSNISDNGTNTVYSNQVNAQNQIINSGKAGFSINTSSSAAAVTVQGGIIGAGLPSPSAPILGIIGSQSGTTIRRYQITALDGTGETLPSTVTETNNSASTLSTSNWVNVSWGSVPGAVQYRVYRCTGASCTPELLTTVSSNNYYDQSNGSPSGALPNINTTGNLLWAGNATISGGALTVGATSQAGSLVIHDGSGGQTISIVSADQTGSYTATIPILGANDTFCLVTLANCGGGGSGVTTVGTFSTTNTAANGATISGSDIIFQSASATAPGMVDTGTQTFAGAKTFNGSVTLAASQTLRLIGNTTANRPSSPTEGMLFYDTDTNRLLTYTGGKWQSTGGEYTIVAASNSPQAIKDAADYVTDGDNVPGAGTIDGDQVEINAALTAAAGGKVYLAQGTYVADATILIPNNTTLAGAGRGTLIELANIDVTDNLIENSDTTTGTGVAIQNLRIDGRKDLNTAGTQHGIYLNGMGNGNGSTARQGAKLTNLWVNNLRNTAIYLYSSSNNTLTGNTAQGNSSDGIFTYSSSNNTLTGNTAQGNRYGFSLTTSSNNNTLTGNTAQGNSDFGFYLTTSSNNTLTGNTAQGNSYGYRLISSSNNVVGNSKIHDNGGSVANNAIYLESSDSNTITGNSITDSSATTTNYAINISNSTSDSNYLADNTLGGGSINDAGTGTIYGGQVDDSGNFDIQPAGNIELMSSTNLTGNLTVSGTVQFSNFNCSALANGGKLTTDASGNLTCAADNSGAGGLDTTGTPTANQIAFFSDADTLQGSANLTFDGTDFAVDTNTLFVDGTNNRVGIGTVTPEFKLNVVSEGATAYVSADSYGSYSIFQSRAANGTIASPTALTIGQNIAQFSARGYDGTAFSGTRAAIIYSTTENWTSSNHGTKIDFYTTSNNSTTISQRMRLDQNGRLALGVNGDASYKLEVEGTSGSGYLGITNATDGDIFNIDASGNATFGGNVTTTGNSTTNGNTTLGDAAGDTVTVNATSTFNAAVTVAANQFLRLTGGTTLNRPASPTEGMLFYDTDTDSLLIYANGKWQADRAESIIVAANDSTQAEKDSADYVADGNTAAAADGDQVEINQALTAATGGKVYLLPGTYTVDASITIPSNTTLAGAGAGSVITIPDGFDAAIDVVTNSDTVGGNNNIVIRDIVIDGNRSNQTTGTMRGIYTQNVGSGTGVSAVKGVTVDSVEVRNVRSTGIYLGWNPSSKNSIMQNVSVINNGGGILVGSSARNVIIDNASVQGNDNAGVSISNNQEVVLSNSTVEFNGTGVDLQHVLNVQIVNNQILSNIGDGIFEDGNTASRNTIISQNIISSNGSEGIYSMEGNYTSIVDNEFYDNAGTGSSSTIYIWSSDNYTIKGNRIIDTAGTGYAIDVSDAGSSNTYLADNTYSGTGASSINDAGTGTIYGGQTNSAGDFVIQPQGEIDLNANTNVTGTLAVSSNATISGGTLTVGTASQAGSLVMHDGNGQTATIDLGDITASTVLSLPATLGAVDTFCFVTLANCTGGGGGANTSLSNLASVDINAALNATSNNLNLTTTTSGNIVLNSAGTIELQDNTNITGDVVIAVNNSLRLTGGTTLNRPASPTEGMLFYDTDTNRLLTYTGGKWQSTGGEYTIVAASNSPQAIRDAADYVTDGDNVAGAGTIDGDQVEINAALTAAAGGKVYLAQGTYVADATILIPNNTTLAGAGRGTLIELADIDVADNLIENSDTTTGTGVTIQDLRLDGRNDLNTGLSTWGIYFDDMGGGSGSTARKGAMVSSVSIENFNIGLNLSFNSSNNIITKSEALNNDLSGFDVTSSSNNNVISNNRAQGAGYGFRISSTAGNVYSGNLAQGNTTGFDFTSTNNHSIANNNAVGNSSYGFRFTSSTYNTVSANFAQGTSRSFEFDNSRYNTISGNSTRDGSMGIYLLNSSTNNTITANGIQNATIWGVYLNSSSSNNTVTGNTISNTGGASNNNGIYISASDSNTITGNSITDSSATTTNYAINISNSTSDTNYLADNTLGGGSINDLGTGTIYGGQVDVSGNYDIQPSGSISLLKNTDLTGTLNVSSNIDTNGSLTVGSSNQLQVTATGDLSTSGTVNIANTSATAFRVQDASTNDILTVNTSTGSVLFGETNASTGKLVVNNSANANAITITSGATTASYDFVLPTSAGSTGQCLVNGATPGQLEWGTCGGGGGGTQVIKLIPEFAGGTLSADGTNNSGAIVADYDSTNRHSYYEWTTTQATAQDYDIIVRSQVPSDYTGGMTTPANYKFWMYDADGATTNAQVTWTMEDAAGTQCFSSAFNGTAANTWEQKSASTLGTCTFAANDVITFRFRVQSTSGAGAIRIGEVDWQYAN